VSDSSRTSQVHLKVDTTAISAPARPTGVLTGNNVFVKICGITRQEDADAAVSCGADALGFVFWRRSPRYVDPDRARTIGRGLRRSVATVGVFVNQPADEVNSIARRAGLTMVQLHGDETPAYAEAIELPFIKALTLGSDVAVDLWPPETLMLVDAHDPERRGGTGTRADWAAAASLATRCRLLLAGGLTPANVAHAIAEVAPYGVDVSSGVESAPGIKDRALLEALFESIHAIHDS
jgi:phosphoribosylanthranilate isomerase